MTRFRAAWRALTGRKPAPKTGVVTLTLSIDTSQFVAAMAHAQAAIVKMAAGFDVDGFAAGLNRLRGVMDEVNAQGARARERELDRAATRWYVRGGLHPMFADPEDRDGQVQAMLEQGYPQTLVVAFIRGWVEHHEDPVAA